MVMPVRLPSMAPRCRAGNTSSRGIGAAVAPSRARASVCIGDANTRILSPLKSSSLRIGLRVAYAVGPYTMSERPFMPLSSPRASAVSLNFGSPITR